MMDVNIIIPTGFHSVNEKKNEMKIFFGQLKTWLERFEQVQGIASLIINYTVTDPGVDPHGAKEPPFGWT